MSDLVYGLYFDPSLTDAWSPEPAYLRGMFESHDAAAAALKLIDSDPGVDMRWTIVEHILGQQSWTEGFQTESLDAD